MKKEVISKFKEKPKTKTAWWAMGLGLGTVLGGPIMLGIFAAVIRPMIDKATSENVGAVAGFGSIVVALIFLVFALVTGIRVFKKGERSLISIIDIFYLILGENISYKLPDNLT